ncbi:NAD(P)-dependent oxidoreductase [Candidatus Peregrinibacteria bacterium]|nr:NAD(P)-dependent oxidoreductase [Candidatus Peregrinibacteria bacterium]
MNNKRILITGASGMIGYHFANRLAVGNKVFATSRFSKKDRRRRLEERGCVCIYFDAVNSDLSALPSEVDICFNFAALFNGEPEELFQVNCHFVGRLLEHIDPNCRVIHTSSVAVYEVVPSGTPIREDMPAFGRGRYGVSKSCSEHIAMHVAEHRNMSLSIFRLWYPYAEDPSDETNYIMELIRNVQAGKEFVFGPRPYPQQPLHLDDLLHFAEKAVSESRHGTPLIVNVSGPETRDGRDIIKLIADQIGIKPNIIEGTDPEVRPTYNGTLDHTLLHTRLGQGKIGCEEGIRRAVSNFLSFKMKKNDE